MHPIGLEGYFGFLRRRSGIEDTAGFTAATQSQKLSWAARASRGLQDAV
jgi:hypothetical protein